MNNILLQAAPLLNWETLLFGEEEANFLMEVALRCGIIFVVVLVTLRLMGKRGVKQISVFELVVILTLGSAAGDSIIYRNVGLLPCIATLLMVVLLYRLVTHFIGKSPKFEELVEGKPVMLIKEGRFSIENFSLEPLAYDEFFAELRLRGVSHLGQVRTAILETSGDVSVFFYEDGDVLPGLPILPDDFSEKVLRIVKPDHYSCEYCGNTEHLTKPGQHACKICKHEVWIKSQKDRRIA